VTTPSSTQQRTLLILRHGHAHGGDWPSDRERDLDKRGRRESKAAGTAARSWVPDLALVSDSVRTRETFDHFSRGLGRTVDVNFLDELYQASASTLRHVVSTTPAEVSTVLVIGHDPSMSELFAELVAGGTSGVDTRLTADGMRTGMLAVFTWTGDWDPAAAEGVRLEAVSRAGDSPS
jgi:phosphohistidine phosphatase